MQYIPNRMTIVLKVLVPDPVNTRSKTEMDVTVGLEIVEKKE
ncbi:MAG: hypothetical protein PUC12_09210 [Clostridiales bacterium]|nr:hypothetical protein [Clostridiales bacterium]